MGKGTEVKMPLQVWNIHWADMPEYSKSFRQGKVSDFPLADDKYLTSVISAPVWPVVYLSTTDIVSLFSFFFFSP